MKSKAKWWAEKLSESRRLFMKKLWNSHAIFDDSTSNCRSVYMATSPKNFLIFTKIPSGSPIHGIKYERVKTNKQQKKIVKKSYFTLQRITYDKHPSKTSFFLSKLARWALDFEFRFSISHDDARRWLCCVWRRHKTKNFTFVKLNRIRFDNIWLSSSGHVVKSKFRFNWKFIN